jgi:hypothetical protein
LNTRVEAHDGQRIESVADYLELAESGLTYVIDA